MIYQLSLKNKTLCSPKMQPWIMTDRNPAASMDINSLERCTAGFLPISLKEMDSVGSFKSSRYEICNDRYPVEFSIELLKK